jgi:DNA-binding GntR family transcriptional regulator
MSITTASNEAQTTDPLIVAARIRQAILNGDYAPNQRMVEADLCEEFHASRGAVRAALLDLTNQGLIERIQNRGARVRAISLPEAIEITEIRMVVEGLCAAKAAENITQDEIVDLKQLREGMIGAVDTGDRFGYADLHQQLHRRIRQISGQHTADNILDRLNAQMVRHRFKLVMHPGRVEVSLPEHVAIIDAVIARDPEQAEAVMRDHLRSVITGLREVAAAAPQ